MRVGEIALVLAMVGLLAALAFRPRSLRPAWLPAFGALALVAVQVAAEGWRNQMLPAYAVAAVIALAVLPARLGPTIRRLIAAAGLLLLAGAAGWSASLPVFRLPPPIGALPVGITTIWVGAPAGGRMAAMVWYPAGQSAAPPVPYVARSVWSGARSRLVATHAVADAPIAGSEPRWPLLVLLPPWLGYRSGGTALAENLASAGFVVAAIDDVDAGQALPMDFTSPTRFDATMRLAGTRVVREAAATSALLNALLDPGHGDATVARLGARIDPARIGVVGFSFGGAAAAEAARTDARIGAVMNLDGWLFGKVLEDWIKQPFLIVSDDTPMPGDDDLHAADAATRLTAELDRREDAQMRAQWARHGGTLLTIAGTRHANFSDKPLTSPWRALTGGGPIAPSRAIGITTTYAAAFFRAAWSGTADPLLSGPSPQFPEVRMETWAVPRTDVGAAQ